MSWQKILKKGIKSMGGTMRVTSYLMIAIVVGFTFGCATKGEIPTEGLTRAETAIQAAQTAEANTYAPLDLRVAEDRLVEAQTAVNNEDYEGAGRLADEALISAQLAEKKSDAERAKQAAQETRDTIEGLHQAVKNP
jgi:hypothetical protein